MPAPVPPPKEWHNWNPPSCHGLFTVEGGERNRRFLKMHQQKNPVWCRQIPVKCETIVMKSPGKAMMTFRSMVLFSRSSAPFFLPVVPKKHLCHPAWRDSPTMCCQNYNFLATKINVWEAQHKNASLFFVGCCLIATPWTVESDVGPSSLGSKNRISTNNNTKKQTWKLNVTSQVNPRTFALVYMCWPS